MISSSGILDFLSEDDTKRKYNYIYYKNNLWYLTDINNKTIPYSSSIYFKSLFDSFIKREYSYINPINEDNNLVKFIEIKIFNLLWYSPVLNVWSIGDLETEISAFSAPDIRVCLRKATV